MRSDHHFVMGKSHDVCQDYALSFGGCAALSDGCSVVRDPSGKQIEAHTDVGARLLVHSALSLSECVSSGPDLARASVKSAVSLARAMGLGRDTISATLISLRSYGRSMGACIIGDGVLAARNAESKEWSVVSYSFSPIPYYPRYIDDPDAPEPAISIQSVRNGGARFTCPKWTNMYIHTFWPEFNCDLLVAMSDGAFSFTKGCEPVPIESDLIDRLLDFRRMGGRFVVRHLRGVLKELEQDGIVNQDDLSMIAVYSE